MSERPSLISVRTDVAKELLIDGLFDAAAERAGHALGRRPERALARAADPQLAWLGYATRAVELERFPVADAPMPWLGELLAGAGVAEVCERLAAAEPLAKPPPDDGVASWRVPGPGGHVRHFLAVRAVGARPPELKRAWLFGFFVHCCEEET